MERNLKEVFHEAAQLPERDRAMLAGLLIETLDPVISCQLVGFNVTSLIVFPFRRSRLSRRLEAFFGIRQRP